MRFSAQTLRSSLLLLLASPLTILALSTPTTIFTLPGPLLPGSWFENLAVRPDGKILATRGDAPEIWQIDPSTGHGALLVSVTGAFNLTGIAEVTPHRRPQTRTQPSPETYVFGSSHIPAPLQVTPGSAKVWTLQFHANPTTPPTVSLLAAMPAAGFINGITPWGRGRVLLSDTTAEAVYLMDAATGAYTTPLTGLTGVNGIRAARGWVYRADHASLTLSRIPVGRDAVATGPAQVLATGQLIDDFAVVVGPSGAGKAYVAGMYDDDVVEVAFGAAGGLGVKRVVAADLSGTGYGLCTVVAFGRRAADKRLLYATVGQGGGNAAIVRLDPAA